MPFEVKNKVVLITGASSGIGREVAKLFAKKGANVALVGRNKNSLENLSKEINGISKIFSFDLTNLDKIPDLVRDVEKSFRNSIDILVNCAGISILGVVEDIPIKEYENIFKVNFFAPLILIQSVVPQMKKNRSGQIINISSGVGKRGLPGVSAYCATKFALNALTESIRVELAPYGINVISVSPGPTDTSFYQNTRIYTELKEKFISKKLKNPEYVAKKIISACVREKKIVTLSPKEKIIVFLNCFFPKLVDYILKRKFFG